MEESKSGRKLNKNLEALFEGLELLPVDSPQWEELEELSSRLQPLIAENKKKRVAVIAWRTLLQEELEKVQKLPTNTLEYWDITRCHQWQVGTVAAEELEEGTEALKRLINRVLEFERIKKRKATTRKENRDQQKKLGWIETKFDLTVDYLDKIFKAGLDTVTEVGEEEPAPSSAETEILGEDEVLDASAEDLRAEIEKVSVDRLEGEEFSTGEEIPARMDSVEETITIKEKLVEVPAEIPDEDPDGAAVTASKSQQPPTGELPSKPIKSETREESVQEIVKPESSQIVSETVTAEPEITDKPVEAKQGEDLSDAGKTVEPAEEPPQETEDETDSSSELTEDQWIEFFWQLITDGDLSAAYWVTHSLAAREEPVVMPVPDWLVAAVQGAWWLDSVRGELVRDLYQVAYQNTVGNSLNEKLMAISAGLLPALKAPNTGLGSWLSADPLLDESVNEIIAAVKEFSNHGHTLRQDAIHAIRGEDRRTKEASELQDDAKRWIEEEPQRKKKIRRATDIWMAWTKPGGRLRNMVDIVAQGEVDRSAELIQLVQEWRGQSNQDWIRQTDSELRGNRQAPDIVGNPRNNLKNQAEKTLELVEEWLELVETSPEQADWFLKQMETLFHHVEKHATQAMASLASLETAASDKLSLAVIHLLKRALYDVCCFLDLKQSVQLDSLYPESSFPHDVEPGLDPGLQYRLFWVPEVGLVDDAGNPPQRLVETAAILYESIQTKRSFTDAIHRHFSLADYRFTDIMIQNLSGDQIPLYARQSQEAMIVSKSYLEDQLRKIGDAIEQSFVDGLIDEEIRAKLSDDLEAVRGSQNQNFGVLESKLQIIREELDTVRTTRLAEQKARWHSLQNRLQVRGLPSSAPETYRQITEFIEDIMMRKGDIVVTDERLSRLEELLDNRQELKIEEFSIQPKRDIYLEYIEQIKDWERNGFGREYSFVDKNIKFVDLTRDLKRGQRPSFLSVGSLPTPRIKEAGNAFNSWYKLKRKKGGLQKEFVKQHAHTILSYLGFTFASVRKTEPIQWLDNGKDWAYLSAAMTAANLSPVPQFGSQHPEPFDVICLWARQDAEVIGSRLHNLKLKSNNVVLIYLGRLTRGRRVNLMRFMRNNNLSLVVLDENLLLYLAREAGARLSTFLKCTLPLTKTNPYAETGPVSSEMFKGRGNEAAELINRLGYSLVYGGRQLGKSALLQQVERDFHNPDADHFVIREDIKPIGDPRSHQAEPNSIWARLKSGLIKFNLLPKTTATKPDKIIEQIETMMENNPKRRVLVLFDEADNFLAADKERNFEIVSNIKRLMDSTDRRFKAIFAGLHSVLRYDGVPNQPLAHLRALQVGPLEPEAAKQLIADPLEALGFRFPEGDETPIFGILAYSNSHPGLIQLFCQKLLERMYAQRPNHVGPYVITRDDVEAVYRQREVQEEIKRRFEWTLALDPRYKALAEMMVYVQLQDRDSFARTFSVLEMLDISRDYWPEAFQKSNSDEFRGYLDELVGLGVLVRNERNEYRLRSPNLVRLMGSDDDIELSLAELESRPISPSFSPDSHHAPLDDNASRYSPFTFAQSRFLNDKRFGVGLIFGSQALGMDLVENAIKTHFVPPDSSGKHRKIALGPNRGSALIQWLEKFRKTNPDTEQLIAYRFIRGGTSGDLMTEQVEAALKFCRKHQRSKRQWMRIFLIFDSVSTYEWLQLPLSEFTRLESEVDSAVTLRRWDEIGIEQRLQQHNKMATGHVIGQLQKILGGWPFLLDKLSDQWGRRGDDPLPAGNKLAQELLDSETGKQFLSATGWGVDSRAKQVFQTIVSFEGVSDEDLVPDILGEDLSVAECVFVLEYLRRMGLIYEDGAKVLPAPVIESLLSAD